jgi:hypothetical protein
VKGAPPVQPRHKLVPIGVELRRGEIVVLAFFVGKERLPRHVESIGARDKRIRSTFRIEQLPIPGPIRK